VKGDWPRGEVHAAPAPRPGCTVIILTALVCLTALLIATEKYGSQLMIEDARSYVLLKTMQVNNNIEDFRRVEPNLRDYFQIPPDLPIDKPKAKP
jgi:hypothetical protein